MGPKAFYSWLGWVIQILLEDLTCNCPIAWVCSWPKWLLAVLMRGEIPSVENCLASAAATKPEKTVFVHQVTT